MGRGSSGLSAGGMNVDWDKWGKPLQGADMKEIIVKDEDGRDLVIGYIEDRLRFVMEEDERKVTKKEVMDEISGWENDDGTYGDDDIHIFVAYDDGTFYESGTAGGKYREKLKKTGVIGATVSTPDYEMVWGGERNKFGEIVPYTTWVNPYDSDAGKVGKSNTYSGYKVVGQYWVREKRTYNERFPDGRPRTRYEIIRKSKVRKVDW